MTAQVLAMTSDLFLQSRILELARTLGTDAKIVTDKELIKETTSGNPRLVVLDLTSTDYDPFLCARKLKTMTSPPKILAVFPHVRTDLRLKAQEEKIDYIVPNSSFLRTLKSLLEKEVVQN